MGVPLIASGCNDQIDVNFGCAAVLPSGVGAIPRVALIGLHEEAESVLVAGFDTRNAAAGQNAVRPSRLIRTKLAALVVHAFIEGFDQLETNHTVVGRASVSQQMLSVSGGLWVQVVNVLGVEDGVDAETVLASGTARELNCVQDVQGRIVAGTEKLGAHNKVRF